MLSYRGCARTLTSWERGAHELTFLPLFRRYGHSEGSYVSPFPHTPSELLTNSRAAQAHRERHQTRRANLPRLPQIPPRTREDGRLAVRTEYWRGGGGLVGESECGAGAYASFLGEEGRLMDLVIAGSGADYREHVPLARTARLLAHICVLADQLALAAQTDSPPPPLPPPLPPPPPNRNMALRTPHRPPSSLVPRAVPGGSEGRAGRAGTDEGLVGRLWE